jgi:CLIP-associating protein 1/2
LVALLSPATTPAGAKSELKKLLQARQIRASITDNIITRVFASATSTTNTPASEVPPSLDEPGLASRSGAATPAGDEVSIVYVGPHAVPH